jgi:subtilisin family serine protease
MNLTLRRAAVIAAAFVLCALAGPAQGVVVDLAARETTESLIVVLKPSADPAAHAAGFGLNVRFVYRNALNGYAADVPAGLADVLAADPLVDFVERDGAMQASTTQTGATWGLDRIDQRNLPLSGTFTYTNTGAGVKAYIIDTGIRRTHSQFGGRAVFGYDAVGPANLVQDCNGHGTHVAGTVGGSTYGVAKGVTLVAVRVLDCVGNGLTSWVIAGVDWVTGNHAAGQPATANMSLGGGASAALDTAVRNSIADGVSYAVAAGNDGANACSYSPARVGEAMTIGATEQNDAKASFSNFGSCVDWFAPGVNITSAWFTTDTATNTISGTSMATPHTTGVAALYLQGNPGSSPAIVRDALYAGTTKGIVTASSTANNHLLFTNY